MRKIFSMNMTDSSDTRFDGDDLAVSHVSYELIRKNEENLSRMQSLAGSSKLPKFYAVLESFSFILGVIFLAAIIKALSSGGALSENFKLGFQNAPYAFIICPLAFAAFAFLIIYRKKLTKNEIDEEAIQQFEREQAEIALQIKSELGVPEDAQTVDVLCFAYKYNRFNEPSPYNSYATHVPLETFLYHDERNVYLANYSAVFAFPKDKFVCVKNNDAKIKLICWNKEDDIHDPKYAEYGMCYDNYGIVMANGFNSLVFNLNGEDVEVDIPSYELARFKSMLNF